MHIGLLGQALVWTTNALLSFNRSEGHDLPYYFMTVAV